MLFTIAIGAGVLIAGLLVFAATKANTFRVERAIRIQAPPAAIFAFIEDFRNWPAWSPYEKLDPAMRKTYSGAPAGTGAAYEWSGNNKAGAGRMAITSTLPASNVTIKLDFSRPFEGHNTAEFNLVPEGGATKVTWSVYGPQAYVAKIMTIFVSMETLVGKEFESGLASLKTVAEKAPPVEARRAGF
jgi:Polyketide cyclase / dehydrase and lipid transport